MNVLFRDGQYTDVPRVRRLARQPGRAPVLVVYIYRRGRATPLWAELRNFHIRLLPEFSR